MVENNANVLMEYRKERRKSIFLLISLILVGYLVVAGYVIYSSNNGDGTYEILLYPETNSVINYKLTGEVSKEVEYYLSELYLPNGETLTFENEYGVVPVKFNEIVELEDDNGTVRYVELAKNKINNENIWFAPTIKYLFFIFGLMFLGITQLLEWFSSDVEDNTSLWGKFENWLYNLPTTVLYVGVWVIRGIGAILLVFYSYFL